MHKYLQCIHDARLFRNCIQRLSRRNVIVVNILWRGIVLNIINTNIPRKTVINLSSSRLLDISTKIQEPKRRRVKYLQVECIGR